MKENKLIAEFMNYPDLGTEGDFSYLKYHTSWDWLMPVMEKIESLGYEVQIRNTDCIIFQLKKYWLKYQPIVDKSSERGKKDSTYQAVVEFIKQYNK